MCKVTILEWAPELTCQKLRADLVAGLTVGVMVIPQSMSYGAIAGWGQQDSKKKSNTKTKAAVLAHYYPRHVRARPQNVDHSRRKTAVCLSDRAVHVKVNTS